jgi:signal transduction histidine kinase/ActR/RegA family two-component response regulator
MQRGALPVSETAWCEGADLSARSIVPEDQPAVREFYAALADGQPLVTCDYSAKAADGSILLLRDAAQLVPSGSRAVLHGFTFDITAAHTAEQQRAQAQRIDALTRMASRLVHDSNNLMMVMSGYGEDLLHALPPESPLRVNVREILAAGERVAVFTRQLSAFTRRAPASIAPVTADDLLNDIGELARTLPRGVTLSASAPGPTATALADRKRLLDVVEALVQRAASGLPNGGEVSILVAIRQGSHFAAAGQSFHTAIPHVCIEIHDSGIAIYPTVLSRIFEPDASSDPVRQKLAPAYQTIREMGGDIEVSPSTPAGTTFRIVLPLATVKGEERPGEAGSGIAEPATDTGAPKTTVLVVDDEAGIRSLLSKVFLREGYEVLEAVQGRDGLDLARSYQGKIDLLLTDVVMPTMNGIELAQSVHAIRPSTKILLISGYMGGSAREFEKLPAGTAFLQKPFTLNALLAKVREVVSANSQAASA